jgi:hypothetical protein
MSYKGTHYKEQIIIGLVIAAIALVVYGLRQLLHF